MSSWHVSKIIRRLARPLPLNKRRRCMRHETEILSTFLKITCMTIWLLVLDDGGVALSVNLSATKDFIETFI